MDHPDVVAADMGAVAPAAGAPHVAAGMIENPGTLEPLGWDPGWAAAFLPFETAGRQPARVSAAHRDAWMLITPDGVLDAVIAGRLRHEALGPGDLPAVGDWVAVTASATDSGPAVIHAVLPRRTVFRRGADDGHAVDDQVLAANVDVALVVTGLDGDFNLRRLERYLSVAYAGGATPVLVLNKADVAEDLDGLRLAAEAVAPGVDVRAISARTGDGVAALASDHLAPGRTAVVLGSSGVGKSTLVNALVGHELLRTGEVRADDSHGRHTTTHRELVLLPGGALLIDTPGIRSLGVAGAEDGLAPTFADITDLAQGCRFRDCSHEQEPGCAVLAALSDGRLSEDRFASHRKLEREAAHVARSADPILRAAERRKWKAIHASVSDHMKHKYGSDR
jgi:ribosome biogenesis GTPase